MHCSFLEKGGGRREREGTEAPATPPREFNARCGAGRKGGGGDRREERQILPAAAAAALQVSAPAGGGSFPIGDSLTPASQNSFSPENCRSFLWAPFKSLLSALDRRPRPSSLPSRPPSLPAPCRGSKRSRRPRPSPPPPPAATHLMLLFKGRGGRVFPPAPRSPCLRSRVGSQ